MKACYIDVTEQQVANVLLQIKKEHSDRIFTMPVMSVAEVSAPTKRQKNHKFKVELLLSPDAIIGDEAIGDFGALAVLNLPRNRINPKYLAERVSVETSEIDKAIKLIENNGYKVVEYTPEMGKAAAECEEMNGDKECFGCPCNICILNR